MVNEDFRAFVSRGFKQFKFDRGYRSDEELLDALNEKGKVIGHSISISGLNKIMRGASSPQLETLYCFNALGLSIDLVISGKSPLGSQDFEKFKSKFIEIVQSLGGKPTPAINKIVEGYREADEEQREKALQIFEMISDALLKPK